MKKLIIALTILSSYSVSSQIAIDIYGGHSLNDDFSFTEEIISGEVHTQSYNPLNIGLVYKYNSFGIGINLSWYEYQTTFNNLEYIVLRDLYTVYLNGGYDRRQINTMVNLSYSFIKGDIISIFGSIGFGHHISNQPDRLTYRTLTDLQLGGQFFTDEIQLNSEMGYDRISTYEFGLRISSPNYFPLIGFIECSLLNNERTWHNTRGFEYPNHFFNGPSTPPLFSTNNLWFKAGLRFEISNEKKSWPKLKKEEVY